MAKRFTNSERMNLVFANLEYEYEDIRELMADTARGVFQDGITKKEAEAKIREMMFSVLELDEADAKNEKLVKRALKKHRTDVFEVIEDVVEDMLVQGWQESEFFEQFVETKNLADGDRNEFWTDKDVILAVANVAGDHHDIK